MGTLKTHIISGVTVIWWTNSEHRLGPAVPSYRNVLKCTLSAVEMQNIFSLNILLTSVKQIMAGWDAKSCSGQNITVLLLQTINIIWYSSVQFWTKIF